MMDKISNVQKPELTSGGLSAVRIFCDICQIFLPRVFHSRLKDLPVVQVLCGSEVVPQVLNRLDMVLLLCG